MAKKKVVLAYSGGLDTSFCCIYLTRDLGYEVHSVIVNTGGFSDEELQIVEKRAYEMGVTSHHVVDETKNFYDTCVRFLIYGNVLKNNTYPLFTAKAKDLQFNFTMYADHDVYEA